MTIGKSALSPASEAVYAALNVAGYTTLSPGGVFDVIDEGAAFPQTVFSVREVEFSTFGKGGKELDIRLRVYGQAETVRDLELAVNKAAELLHHTLPAVTGFTTLLVVYEGAFPLPDILIGGMQTHAYEGLVRWLVEQN